MKGRRRADEDIHAVAVPYPEKELSRTAIAACKRHFEYALQKSG